MGFFAYNDQTELFFSTCLFLDSGVLVVHVKINEFMESWQILNNAFLLGSDSKKNVLVANNNENERWNGISTG